MGQAIRRLPETPALRGPGAAPEPLGSWIARERRLRGLTLEDVAAVTRIPRRSLERLEGGAFDAQQDGFTRGFVRTVADAIGLDPLEASARLTGEAAPEPRQPLIRVGLIALGMVLLVGLALLAASLPWRAGSPSAAPPSEGSPPPELRRRDFVRELALERAGARPPAPAPPAPAPPSAGAP